MPAQLDEAREREPGQSHARRRKGGQGTSPSSTGLVLVDKPAGPSSFEVVRSTARMLGENRAEGRVKAGHAGTLDPAASGLLLVLTGAATRLARYLVGLDKRYLTEIELGLTTTTGDAEGEPLTPQHVPPVAGIAGGLVGELELPVPAASAIKIDGERAYRRHRRGEELDMPLRRSTVRAAELVRQEDNRITLELDVSSGTYVRAIAHHLGGHCRSIRRLSVGPFAVADADSTVVLPPLEALPFLPSIAMDVETAAALRHGRRVPCASDGLARAVHDGELVAVVSCRDGLAQPETVLAR